MSNLKKILTIVGARPQFIKAAPISRRFSQSSAIKEVILHTGQHFDQGMSDIFFNELKIPAPAINLNINGGDHGQMTGRMLEKIETVMQSEKPDAVLVYGDTNSTLAGALAASKLHIPICHIEAGLRSFNRKMPEEINRVLTDHLSALLFCPTLLSVENLQKEGIRQGVHHVGDVMCDAVLQMKNIVQKYSTILQKLQLTDTPFGVLTIHRAENTTSYDTLKNIFEYLENEAQKQKIKIIFPVHPRTKQIIENKNMVLHNIMLCEPLGYLDMQSLLSRATLVLTDSGGLQKEAYFHEVPCITLRKETEWTETVDSGWNRLWENPHYKTPRRKIEDYGEGKASEHIVDIIENQLFK